VLEIALQVKVVVAGLDPCSSTRSGNDLDGDLATEPCVPRATDLAHPADAHGSRRPQTGARRVPGVTPSLDNSLTHRPPRTGPGAAIDAAAEETRISLLKGGGRM